MKPVYVINKLEWMNQFDENICVDEFKFLCQKECYEFYNNLDHESEDYSYSLTFYWIAESDTIESADARDKAQLDEILNSIRGK